MKNKHLINTLICSVKEYNKEQQDSYNAYLLACKDNGVPGEPMQRYFHTFNYKTGFVCKGQYARYFRTKKQAISFLGLDH